MEEFHGGCRNKLFQGSNLSPTSWPKENKREGKKNHIFSEFVLMAVALRLRKAWEDIPVEEEDMARIHETGTQINCSQKFEKRGK